MHDWEHCTSLQEERKTEIIRDLDSHYSMKQMTLNAYSQKGQETIDKIYQVKNISNWLKNIWYDKKLDGALFL